MTCSGAVAVLPFSSLSANAGAGTAGVAEPGSTFVLTVTPDGRMADVIETS